jgi:hypothetical protein
VGAENPITADEQGKRDVLKGQWGLWGSKTLIWKLRVIQRSSVFELVVLEG